MTGSFISEWDSSPPGFWDSGLDWDTNVTPPGFVPGDPSGWLALVTSEHRSKPNFMATLAGALQPFADMVSLLQGMPSAFNAATASGAQLDIVGQWVNVSRNIETVLTGVYFTLGSATLGLGSGHLQGPYDPSEGLTALSDDAYRTLIRATIAANCWDGTITSAYTVWGELFAGTGTGILIQDKPPMHMVYALTGNTPDAVTLALYLGGYLNLKPAGVAIDAFKTPYAANVPYFGLSVQNSVIAGPGTGAFGNSNPGY